MSAKLLRFINGQPVAPSYETILMTAQFARQPVRRRTLASILEAERHQADLEEWERWKKAAPFSRKANH